VILNDEEAQGYIQRHPQPGIGYCEGKTIQKGAVAAKKEMYEICIYWVMHGNILKIERLKIERLKIERLKD